MRMFMDNAQQFFPNLRPGKAVVFLFALSVACSFPLFKDLYLTCGGDWDFFYSLYEIPAISLFEYRQFPLWNPYCGGGMPFFANPQTGFPSPIFLVTSLFGVVAGLKISIWLHTFLGLWGMWLLSGNLGIKGPARLAPPLIFMFSSSWALHLAAGHVVWLPAAFLPFVFLAFRKSFVHKRWLLAAALFESTMLYEGGTYVLGFSILFVGIYAILYSVQIGSWRPVLTLLAMNILTAALSAPKLLPVLELLQSHPRPTDLGSPLSWDTFLSLFIERNTSLGSGWWELGSYFGVVVLVTYLGSFTLIRKYQALVLASFFMLLVALGNFAHYSPWNILHELPLFSGFQVPTRSLIVFCFSVALLVGLYLSELGDNADKRIAVFVAVVVAVIGIDLFLVSSRIVPEALKPVNVPSTTWLLSRKPIAPVTPKLSRIYPDTATSIWNSSAAFHQNFYQIRVPDLQRFADGAYSAQYLPLLQNRGVVDAYETIPFGNNAHAVADRDYQGEFYLQKGGRVALLNWSPNRFVYHVTLRDKDRLVINQNFWPGWKTSRGVLARHEGLLAVDLPPGDYDVAVRYLPRSFLIGILIFFISVAGIITAFRVMGEKPATGLSTPEPGSTESSRD